MSKAKTKRIKQHKTRKALNSCYEVSTKSGKAIHAVNYGTGLDKFDISTKEKMNNEIEYVSPNGEGLS